MAMHTGIQGGLHRYPAPVWLLLCYPEASQPLSLLEATWHFGQVVCQALILRITLGHMTNRSATDHSGTPRTPGDCCRSGGCRGAHLDRRPKSCTHNVGGSRTRPGARDRVLMVSTLEAVADPIQALAELLRPALDAEGFALPSQDRSTAIRTAIQVSDRRSSSLQGSDTLLGTH